MAVAFLDANSSPDCSQLLSTFSLLLLPAGSRHPCCGQGDGRRRRQRCQRSLRCSRCPEGFASMSWQSLKKRCPYVLAFRDAHTNRRLGCGCGPPSLQIWGRLKQPCARSDWRRSHRRTVASAGFGTPHRRHLHERAVGSSPSRPACSTETGLSSLLAPFRICMCILSHLCVFVSFPARHSCLHDTCM